MVLLNEFNQKANSEPDFVLDNLFKYHLIINEIIFNIKILNFQNSQKTQRFKTNPPTKCKHTIAIVTESSIHGKVMKMIIEENHFEAAVYSINEFNYIFKKKKIVVGNMFDGVFTMKEVENDNENDRIFTWFFFEDSLKMLDNGGIYTLLEKIKNYELINSIIKAPIIFNTEFDYEEEALKTFKGFNVNLLKLKITENKKKLFEENIRILKEMETLDLYLTKNIIIKISRKNILIRLLSNVEDKDIEMLELLIFDDKLFDLFNKLLIIIFEIGPLTSQSEKVCKLLLNIDNKFNNKVLLYVSKNNHDIIERIKKNNFQDRLKIR